MMRCSKRVRSHFVLVLGGLSSLVTACAELLGDVDVREDESVAEQPLLAFPAASPVASPPGPSEPVTPSDPSAPQVSGSAAGEPEPPAPSVTGMELGSGSATLVCETGSFRCIGAQLEYCRGGLAWMDWQTCESAALCESEPAGRCLPALCSPEARRCTDRALERCNEHGTSWLETARCATAAHCDTSRGECLETPCAPGQRRCNGELLEQCSADQLGWDAVEDCLTPALCENDVAGTTASCMSPSCDVGEYECAPDGSLQTCNLEQTAFVRVAQCATADLCNAPQGLCETPVCQAQQRACASNGEILVCNLQRTAFVSQVPTRSCSAGERCNVMSGTCERVEAPPASPPGTPSPPITRPSAPPSSGGNDDERDEAEPADRGSATTDPDDDGRGRQDSRNDDDRGNDGDRGNDDNRNDGNGNNDDRGNDGNGNRR